MNDRREGKYGVAILLFTIVLALCIGAGCYVQSLTDCAAIQRFSAIATAAAAIGGIAASLALVIYTIETQLLRKASEEQLEVSKEQLEGSMMPVVLLEIVSENRDGDQPPSVKKQQFRNIGTGPAFDVTVEPVAGRSEWVLSIEGVHVIESNGTVPAVCSVRQDVLHGHAGDVAERFANDNFPHGTQMIVKCRGLSGRGYYSHHLIRLDDRYRKWSTEFKSIESRMSQ